jgi:hypothetical protein
MSDPESIDVDLFQEPTDYYRPEAEATFATHTLRSGERLRLRLVGHNPLWVRLQDISLPYNYYQSYDFYVLFLIRFLV